MEEKEILESIDREIRMSNNFLFKILGEAEKIKRDVADLKINVEELKGLIVQKG
jgi:predicted  nucleic acid-binding Zn-ribbon protein